MTGGRETVTAEVAAAVLRAGGIVVHPTEAVWGLACDPASEAATLRLLALKQRSVDKGLILVAASPAQLDRHVDWNALPPARRDAMLASWPGPNTWIVPASAAVPAWIRGAHASVAVRVTAHAPAAALCTAFGGAIVSTSANPAARRRHTRSPASTPRSCRASTPCWKAGPAAWTAPPPSATP